MTYRSLSRPIMVTFLTAALAMVPMGTAFAAVFTDAFESGTTAAWTQNVGGVTVETAGPFAPAPEGTRYARLNTTGPSEYLQRSISTQPNLYVDAKVNVGAAPNGLTLIKLNTATGGQLVSLKINKNGKLLIKNHVSGGGPTSSTILTKNAWHELELHATTSGASSLTEVWLDGTQITALTSNASLGTTPIGTVQLGNNGTVSGGFDVGLDAVTVDTARIGGGSPTPPATPANLREVSRTSSTASIAWDAVPGATAYGVYRGTIKQGPDLTVTTFDDTGLSPSTPYSYTVDAFNSAGRSLRTMPLIVTTDAAPPPSEDVIVRAAADVACDPADPDFNGGNGTASKCKQTATSNLLSGPDVVLLPGDTAYDCGGPAAFTQSFDPSWGRFKAILWAAVGDNEYNTPTQSPNGTGCTTAKDAAGYYSYFGNRGGSTTATPLPGVNQSSVPGTYSFNLPEGCTPGVGGTCTWHVIALNSNCQLLSGGCGVGSPTSAWLQQDLADNGWAVCSLAMMHYARFASKKNGNAQINDKVLQPWKDLVAGGVDVVLSGHSHFYERFGPQDAIGNAMANGASEFIVGTGGRGLGGIADANLRLPNSEAGQSTTFGVLDMTLRSSGYDWNFLPIAGSSYSDSGTRNCTG